MSAQHIGALPVSQDVRCRLLRGKVVPQGVFGAEVTPVSSTGMRALQSACVASVMLQNRCRSVALSFELFAREFDPAFEVIRRRACELRRRAALDPQVLDTVRGLVQYYTEGPEPGLVDGQASHADNVRPIRA
eukprot:12612467-Alexandrium_andersonii.AAC.1